MTKTPTEVIFLWHMHQPCYKDPQTGVYLLPWVRLHGVKDYYGMAAILDKFDKVKATFNFSGILLAQLLEYANGQAQDYYAKLSLKNPADLSARERKFIVDRFFSVNYERGIRFNKRYLQLYRKKQGKNKKFSNQELGDLQAIFNLSWFHPYSLKKDKNLKLLLAKGCGYKQQDKKYIIDAQYRIISKTIPLYRRLLKEKRIELSVTPYSHPIMPLVCDTDIVREFSYLNVPRLRFSHPEDCVWHLDKACDIFSEVFGYSPEGSWPSEGSVSEEVVKIYAKQGFKWIGTDEGILFKSLTSEFVPYDLIKDQRHIIYRPYNFRGMNIFFRDRNLSDAISFIYQGWEDSAFAANDLLEHFKRTHYYTKNLLKHRAITIIMDGENAWEYYKNGGIDFLKAVYSGLERSDILCSSTPSEFLSREKAKPLQRLSPGSWINSDFGVWVGSRDNNRNWQALKRVRDLIEHMPEDEKTKQKLLGYFYILEGSDWNWWNTFEDVAGDFEKIFFSYIKKIYKILGKKPPSYIM